MTRDKTIVTLALATLTFACENPPPPPLSLDSVRAVGSELCVQLGQRGTKGDLEVRGVVEVDDEARKTLMEKADAFRSFCRFEVGEDPGGKPPFYVVLHGPNPTTAVVGLEQGEKGYKMVPRPDAMVLTATPPNVDEAEQAALEEAAKNLPNQKLNTSEAELKDARRAITEPPKSPTGATTNNAGEK
jgi:hypothetical protein